MTNTLQAAILAVDGVTDVYPARNLWQRLPGQVASLVQPSNGAPGDAQLLAPVCPSTAYVADEPIGRMQERARLQTRETLKLLVEAGSR